ncbi:MAG: HAMP domain-containing protein [Chloroflexia bacterium]|nr:HAMP domain-containing protein [Chloroflexia bacterium]
MRLWLKFLLATGVVILICLTVVGLLSGAIIRRRFDSFVRSQERGNLQQIVPYLADYYQRTGGWAGVEQLLQRRGHGQNTIAPGQRLFLLDPERRVLLDTQNEWLGRIVPEAVWEAGVPIIVGGEEVGRLVSGAALQESQHSSLLEQGFLNSLSWALLGASLAGALAAIIVATILALQLTAPARRLTQAAQRIASGELEHRVEVHSQDELGQVGLAFNDMAAALAHQEELRRHMVADIAHELRTPLSVMRVELEALQDGLSDLGPEVVASLSEEVQLLSRLVEDLRLLSLVEAGQLALQPAPTSLGAVIDGIAQQVAATAERKGISLETRYPPDLPPAMVDADRLRQVLLNLLHNALRHTPAGGAVQIAAQAQAGPLHLSVQDNGEGIPPQELPHIFERFYRTDGSRSRSSGGSGLGLTIARGLVEAMGGRIWAESEVGRGTTVHLTLPRADIG